MIAITPIQPGPMMLRRRARPREQGVQEHLHQCDEAGELRAGRDPRRHRRGRPFVGVGRPLVERHRRDLEPEADQHQQDRRRRPATLSAQPARVRSRWPGLVRIASNWVVPVRP